MLIGLSGTLVSHHFAERVVHDEFAGRLGEATARHAFATFARWWTTVSAQLGPASSIRAIWDVAAVPLAQQLGFTVASDRRTVRNARCARLTTDGPRVELLATTWDESLDGLWRDAVRHAILSDVSWILCTNGRQLRLVDGQRTYSRAYVQFELQHAAVYTNTFMMLWALLRAESFAARAPQIPLIAELVRSSARHGEAVSRSLRHGVVAAVQYLMCGLHRCERRDLAQLFDESLTVVYRVLFLMFAESRGLVPSWHPVYRDSYTIESLRQRIEPPGQSRGVWEALQAIARLANHGCRAGTLLVPPFNGRLFSPARSPLADTCAVDDELAARALAALSATTRHKHRTRIDYRDLGVEQLGAVYESILEYEPVFGTTPSAVMLRRGGGARKSTGSFYTPQSITDYVVRRTLHPLVENATADAILRLRVVDPAMGSGAFLVSACRYLARAYERALIREGSAHASDVREEDRAIFRRQVSQRCLFGVDLNPTAVQLARLSLWLATLSAGKPLTFLDHHLVTGNSLLGAGPADLVRQPPGRRPARAAARDELPLYSDADLELSLARAVAERRWLEETDDDTAEVVRRKEMRLEQLRAAGHWKTIADLWCACWMWRNQSQRPEPGVFASLADKIRTGASALSETVSARLLEEAADIACDRRFFHWPFEFPEAYFDASGNPVPNGGFDAVLGNPPWDMLRAGGPERTFFRHSGVYRHQSAGQLNRYQMFAERALMLAKRAGRIGLVLPSGFATDHGAARLRRTFFNRTAVETITGFENRRVIFPVHRSVRFLVCISTAGPQTSRIACQFGIDHPGELDTVPDAGDRSPRPSHPISVTPAFLAAIAGDNLAIPELRSEIDLRILETVVHNIPRLDDSRGWDVRFGRELNATDDRASFHKGNGGMPVLEGKHIEPFRAHPEQSTLKISERRARGLLDAASTYLRPRLAYRDVASKTNRLSLISAILPARVVTTHSLFCLKTLLPGDDQAFLCAMLNSYVANYLVRQVMTTHLGSTTVEALRVPRPRHDSAIFEETVELSHDLRREHSGVAYARLQALAARCYGLSQGEFEHVLGTFPLIGRSDQLAALEEFRRGGILE